MIHHCSNSGFSKVFYLFIVFFFLNKLIVLLSNIDFHRILLAMTERATIVAFGKHTPGLGQVNYQAKPVFL